MPVTFMKYFCVASSIRWLMSTWTVPAGSWHIAKYYRKMVAAYKRTYGDALQGIFNTSAQTLEPFDFDHQKTELLDDETYRMLLSAINNSPGSSFKSFFSTFTGGATLSRRVQMVRKLSLGGVTYARRNSSLRNSFVLFSKAADNGARRAGQVQQIFYHQRREDGKLVVEPFLVVQEYKPLAEQHTGLDPYREFSQLNAHLRYNEFQSDKHILKIDSIVSHFAAYMYTPEDIGRECIVVKSLERVSQRSVSLYSR